MSCYRYRFSADGLLPPVTGLPPVTDWRAQAATVPCFLEGQVGGVGLPWAVFVKYLCGLICSWRLAKNSHEQGEMAKHAGSKRQRGLDQVGPWTLGHCPWGKPSSQEPFE